MRSLLAFDRCYANRQVFGINAAVELGSQGEFPHFASCYGICLQLAKEIEVNVISSRPISTGIYGYQRQQAAQHNSSGNPLLPDKM